MPRLAVAFLLTVLAACSSRPSHPPTPQPPPFDVAQATATCQAIWRENCTQGSPSPDRLTTVCVGDFRTGVLLTDVRVRVSATSECIAAKVLPAAPTPRLKVYGRFMVKPDGSKFRWKGVTAFALLELVAHGKGAQAEEFMAWAQATGFNVVRVLAMNHGFIDLKPEDGWAHADELFKAAAKHGLYVQLVALAGTAQAPWNTQTFVTNQVRRVGQLCGQAPNCIGEIANEPYHSSQYKELYQVAQMQALSGLVPASVPLAYGATRTDEGAEGLKMSGGRFIVTHKDRSRDPWNQTRRTRELEALSSQSKKYVVSSEDYGFGEAAVSQNGNKRYVDPNLAFTQGALSRIFEVGANFHCDDCLLAKVPGPKQQAAAKAFIQGVTVVPDSWTLKFLNAGHTGSVLDKTTGCVRQYPATQGNKGLVIALGCSGAVTRVYQGGWKQTRVIVDRGAVKAIEVGK